VYKIQWIKMHGETVKWTVKRSWVYSTSEVEYIKYWRKFGLMFGVVYVALSLFGGIEVQMGLKFE